METNLPIIHLNYWEFIPGTDSHADMVLFGRLGQVVFYSSIIHHELVPRKKYAPRLHAYEAYFPGGHRDYSHISGRITKITNPCPLSRVEMRTPLGKARHLYVTTEHDVVYRLYFHQKEQRYSELLALASHNPPRGREMYRFFSSVT